MAKKAGTIPFQKIDGNIWIYLVSSRKRQGKFVLPKGRVGSSESFTEAALRETLEEAGLEGVISPEKIKIKILPTNPKSAGKKIKMDNIKFFPLLITDIKDEWPEKKIRKRLRVMLEDLPESKMIERDIDILKSHRFELIANDLAEQTAV